MNVQTDTLSTQHSVTKWGHVVEKIQKNRKVKYINEIKWIVFFAFQQFSRQRITTIHYLVLGIETL